MVSYERAGQWLKRHILRGVTTSCYLVPWSYSEKHVARRYPVSFEYSDFLGLWNFWKEPIPVVSNPASQDLGPHDLVGTRFDKFQRVPKVTGFRQWRREDCQWLYLSRITNNGCPSRLCWIESTTVLLEFMSHFNETDTQEWGLWTKRGFSALSGSLVLSGESTVHQRNLGSAAARPLVCLRTWTSECENHKFNYHFQKPFFPVTFQSSASSFWFRTGVECIEDFWIAFLTGDDRQDRVAAFGCEDCGLEYFHCRSMSPHVSPLLIATAFLKNDAQSFHY